MEPIDYQSPDTGRVAPEQLEEVYGCFPAVLSVVLGMVGCLLAGWGRSVVNRWASGAVDLAAAGGLACGWAAAVATLRHRRGGPFGAIALLALTTLTGVFGYAVLLRR